MDNTAHPARTSITVRTSVPRDIHARLRHLALDLGVTLGDLMVDGAVLVLRYHERGEGLREPLPPKQDGNQ
jgi:hypothetical protein